MLQPSERAGKGRRRGCLSVTRTVWSSTTWRPGRRACTTRLERLLVPSTRSKKYLTALASNGVPSWSDALAELELRRGRRRCVHDSASPGSICILALNRTRFVHHPDFTCSPDSGCSADRGCPIPPAANVSVPPATGACATTGVDRSEAHTRIAPSQSATIRRIVLLLSGAAA